MRAKMRPPDAHRATASHATSAHTRAAQSSRVDDARANDTPLWQRPRGMSEHARAGNTLAQCEAILTTQQRRQWARFARLLL